MAGGSPYGRLTDLYIQHRQMALRKGRVESIYATPTPSNSSLQHSHSHHEYLTRLNANKQQIKSRLQQQRHMANQLYFTRVTRTPNCVQLNSNPESLPQLGQRPHHSAHINQLRENNRISQDNKGMAERLSRQGSRVPTAHSLKDHYHKMREYGKIARKAPSYMRYQESIINRSTSSSRLSRRSTSQLSRGGSAFKGEGGKRLSPIERELIAKQ